MGMEAAIEEIVQPKTKKSKVKKMSVLIINTRSNFIE